MYWKVFLALVCAVLAILLVAYAFTDPLSDFVEYWTAAHLLRVHANPYSQTEMFRMEQALGWSEPLPLMFANPPWALPLIVPLEFAKSYEFAWLSWVLVLAFIVALSSRLLMDLYFKDLRIPEISTPNSHRWLIAFTFYPVLICIKFAQLSSIVLLGLAGFLYFENRRRPVLAGAALSLTLLKPHLVFLIWLAMIINIKRPEVKRMLASAAVVVLISTGIALVHDAHVTNEYLSLMTSSYWQMFPSGIAGAVRRAFGERNRYWLQFVPPVLGVMWFCGYWWKCRHNWSWIEQMPVVVTASVLTTAYGWLFDQTLLAIPIIAIMAKYGRNFGAMPRSAFLLYTTLNIFLIVAAVANSLWASVPAPFVIATILYSNERFAKKNKTVMGAHINA